MTTLAAIDDRLKRIETQLERVPTVDDPKGFVTKADLAGMPTVDDRKGFMTETSLRLALAEHAEREGRLMRKFVLETVRHSSADLRAAIKHDMLVLTEDERERWRVVADGLQAAIASIGRVDEDARQRDAGLDGRVSSLESPFRSPLTNVARSTLSTVGCGVVRVRNDY